MGPQKFVNQDFCATIEHQLSEITEVSVLSNLG